MKIKNWNKKTEFIFWNNFPINLCLLFAFSFSKSRDFDENSANIFDYVKNYSLHFLFWEINYVVTYEYDKKKLL